MEEPCILIEVCNGTLFGVKMTKHILPPHQPGRHSSITLKPDARKDVADTDANAPVGRQVRTGAMHNVCVMKAHGAGQHYDINRFRLIDF